MITYISKPIETKSTDTKFHKFVKTKIATAFKKKIITYISKSNDNRIHKFAQKKRNTSKHINMPAKIKAKYLQQKKMNILNWSTFEENPNTQPLIMRS